MVGIYFHFTGSQRVYKNTLYYKKISNSQHGFERGFMFLVFVGFFYYFFNLFDKSILFS